MTEAKTTARDTVLEECHRFPPLLAKRAVFLFEYVARYVSERRLDRLSVLDVGCGPGLISLALGSLGHEVVAIDRHPKIIQQCQSRNSFSHVSFLECDAETLDLDQQFDIIVAFEVLEHLQHPDLLLTKFSELMKEGGTAVISIPNGYCPWELFVSRLYHRTRLLQISLYVKDKIRTLLHQARERDDVEIQPFCYHSTFFTFGKLKELIATSGLHILQVRHSDLGLFPEYRWMRPLKRIECMIANFVPHEIAGGWILVVERRGKLPATPGTRAD